jgi:hypothetical protein
MIKFGIWFNFGYEFVPEYVANIKHGARNLHKDFQKFRVSEYTKRNLSRNLKLSSSPFTNDDCEKVSFQNDLGNLKCT